MPAYAYRAANNVSYTKLASTNLAYTMLVYYASVLQCVYYAIHLT